MAATKRRDDPVFVEALRSMPALVLAREEDRAEDVRLLLAGITDMGKETGLCAGQTNQAMFKAAFWWFREALRALADDRGQSLEEAVQVFSSVAADFVVRHG